MGYYFFVFIIFTSLDFYSLNEAVPANTKTTPVTVKTTLSTTKTVPLSNNGTSQLLTKTNVTANNVSLNLPNNVTVLSTTPLVEHKVENYTDNVPIFCQSKYNFWKIKLSDYCLVLSIAIPALTGITGALFLVMLCCCIRKCRKRHRRKGRKPNQRPLRINELSNADRVMLLAASSDDEL